MLEIAYENERGEMIQNFNPLSLVGCDGLLHQC